MKNNHNNWKYLQYLHKTNKCNPPDKLLYNGKVSTSLQELANISNNFFISKIESIIRTFTPSNISSLQILQKLIPKPQSKFLIPPITIDQTLEILNKIPNSNSIGHDNLNNKFLKKIKHTISPHLTHLINTIILTKKFPNIYKITRILPLSKPNSDPTLINSYHPILN